MSIRKSDMSQWRINTWRPATFEDGLVIAEKQLKYSAEVLLWPLGLGWLVIAHYKTWPN